MERRPWGWFRVLAQGDGFKVKELFVEEGKRTSLQYHSHRKEVWVVLSGWGRAQIGDSFVELEPGSIVVVDKGVIHRIEGKEGGVRILEVWTGKVLSEDDIVRVEDDYGRA